MVKCPRNKGNYAFVREYLFFFLSLFVSEYQASRIDARDGGAHKPPPTKQTNAAASFTRKKNYDQPPMIKAAMRAEIITRFIMHSRPFPLTPPQSPSHPLLSLYFFLTIIFPFFIPFTYSPITFISLIYLPIYLFCSLPYPLSIFFFLTTIFLFLYFIYLFALPIISFSLICLPIYPFYTLSYPPSFPPFSFFFSYLHCFLCFILFTCFLLSALTCLLFLHRHHLHHHDN